MHYIYGRGAAAAIFFNKRFFLVGCAAAAAAGACAAYNISTEAERGTGYCLFFLRFCRLHCAAMLRTLLLLLFLAACISFLWTAMLLL